MTTTIPEKVIVTIAAATKYIQNIENSPSVKLGIFDVLYNYFIEKIYMYIYIFYF